MESINISGLEMIGYCLFFLMGIVLGLVGAGGSILTIPILIYTFNVPVLLATTFSLFIVGFTSFVGMLRYYQTIHFSKALLFAVPSVFGIVLTRYFILPHLPDTVYGFTLDSILLHLLVLVMFLASYFMIREPAKARIPEETGWVEIVKVVFIAFFLGMLMGFLGAGGGFLIIPTLVLLLGVDMRDAVGTSLFIITLNSAVGFIVDQQVIEKTELVHVLTFTALAIVGLLLGVQLGTKVSGKQLKIGFGWLVLAVAAMILLKEWT